MLSGYNKRHSIGHVELHNGEATLSQMLPTASPKHHRAVSFSSPSSYSIEKVDKVLDLYHQSKLEAERLKDKNKSQAELIERLQSECNELRSQIKEFELIKQRGILLKETLDKVKEENQKLNQQMILAKVEASSLNEKLAGKMESEDLLNTARVKLEENLRTMQAQRENLAVQLESTNVKLESKLEKISIIETQNKELRKQVNELRLKVSQQQTQLRVEQNIHQREMEKEQQKAHKLEHDVQEKDKRISNLEGKMEVASLNLKQLQESYAAINEKRTTNDTLLQMHNISKPICNPYETDCEKQDLIEIIEVHVEQIEELHQQIYIYEQEIVKLQQKLKVKRV